MTFINLIINKSCTNFKIIFPKNNEIKDNHFKEP